MGGRGVFVNNNNSQFNFKQYMLQQEVEQIRSTWNMHRQQTLNETMSSNQTSSGGATRNHKVPLKRCACCRLYTIPAFTEFETCSVCGWIDDPIQNKNPDLEEGANTLSLHQAQTEWRKNEGHTH